MFPAGTPSLKAALQGPVGVESQVLGQSAPTSHVLAFLLSRPSSAFPHLGMGSSFPGTKRTVMVRSKPVLTCHITGPQEKGFFTAAFPVPRTLLKYLLNETTWMGALPRCPRLHIRSFINTFQNMCHLVIMA